MAIVEDEVRNESEEENEIEVVVEEDDADRDSDDSEDEDDDIKESKVAELERRISEYPYNYNEHIELIENYWRLSDLDRWRGSFERLHQMTVLQPEHWLMRLQTEMTLTHSGTAQDRIANLFNQALIDCYSISILSEWCTWSLTSGDTAVTRAQIDEAIKRAGADPFSGKLFWDAKMELEKAELENMSEGTPEYKAQQERILFCLEETISRPLFRCDEALQQFHELAEVVRDNTYIDKVMKQHDIAVEYLQKITPFEENLLTADKQDNKYKVYLEYIETVKELSQNKKYSECDSDGILKVLYDRATSDCVSEPGLHALLLSWARHAQRSSSRGTYARVLQACARRCPRRHSFWTLTMQQAEHEGKSFEEVKGIFETAISKGMESYKDAESLWLSYLEFVRRQTQFDDEDQVQKLRQTFRLAWDSLAEAWDEEANDCEIPLFWARLEYTKMHDPKQGKEIFEEIFKYGENKTMSKYWEALIQLECSRTPPPSENKRRELYRRALRFVCDYPPAVARLWTDYERDYGHLDTARECFEICQEKLHEWKESYQAMKDKMLGKKQRGKQTDKKTKLDKKLKKRDVDQGQGKTKRKSGEQTESIKPKRKKEEAAAVEEMEKEVESGSGLKRSRVEDDDSQEGSSKRTRSESAGEAGGAGETAGHSLGPRDACTLFISNLEFKVNEKKLRDELAQYGEIISLRVKAGVKAFGGSICYCQYKTPESVDEALKHDRTPLEGRPMFFTRYSAKKGKAGFKYATTAEKNKLFVKNLPYSHCTKEALTDVFNKYGALKDVRVVTFKDGKPKGLAYIEYEDEEAAAQALDKTHGLLLGDRRMDVAFSAPPPKDSVSAPVASLGQPKRDTGKGMRRTQLSSFIPSVLQKPSTSGAANGDSKRPLSNTDFRTLLLNK